LLDGLAARGRREVNVIVVSDHGFSSHTGDTKSLRQRLGTLANNVVIAGSAIHVRQGGARVRDSVVRLLQAWPEAGAIFTAPGASRDEGIVRGTLSTAAIGWQHARSADVLWSADWSHEVNAVGYSGSTRQSGVAGHGTSSPHDIRATFVAHGPAFRKAAEAPLPSSNADIVPTVLHVLGQPSHAPGITGRPLLELLTTAPRTRGEARRDSVAVAAEGYRTVLFRTRVADTWYVDSTRTTRWSPR
jgi:arylsulfatase A-like enzyme